MMVKNNEKKANIFACIGSAGAGFNFVEPTLRLPLKLAKFHYHKPWGSQGIKPNKLNNEVGS